MSPCVEGNCLGGQGKQLVLGEVGIEVIPDGKGDGDLGALLFDVEYVEKAITLVGQDDMKNGLILLIQLVVDVFINPAACSFHCTICIFVVSWHEDFSPYWGKVLIPLFS